MPTAVASSLLANPCSGIWHIPQDMVLFRTVFGRKQPSAEGYPFLRDTGGRAFGNGRQSGVLLQRMRNEVQPGAGPVFQ